MKNLTLCVLIFVALGLSSCMSASQHKAEVQNDSTDRITVGTVQKEIKVGISASEVAAALGSPNIVSTDDERREERWSWIVGQNYGKVKLQLIEYYAASILLQGACPL